jgi:hypothetical protein
LYPILYQSLNQRWSANKRVSLVVGVSWVQPMQAISYRALTVRPKENPMMLWWGKSRWHGQSVSSPKVFKVSLVVVAHTRHFFHAPPKKHGV